MGHHDQNGFVKKAKPKKGRNELDESKSRKHSRHERIDEMRELESEFDDENGIDYSKYIR